LAVFPRRPAAGGSRKSALILPFFTTSFAIPGICDG
jgi:hypothetical protein